MSKEIFFPSNWIYKQNIFNLFVEVFFSYPSTSKILPHRNEQWCCFLSGSYAEDCSSVANFFPGPANLKFWANLREIAQQITAELSAHLLLFFVLFLFWSPSCAIFRHNVHIGVVAFVLCFEAGQISWGRHPPGNSNFSKTLQSMACGNCVPEQKVQVNNSV